MKPWDEFATLMGAVWAHFRVLGAGAESENFALHVTNAIETIDDDFQLAWRHVEPVLLDVVREGRIHEIHDTIFSLRDPDMGALTLTQVLPLLRALDLRKGDTCRSDVSWPQWSDTFTYACDLIDRLATREIAESERSAVYQLVEGWTREPLGLSRAIRTSVKLADAVPDES